MNQNFLFQFNDFSHSHPPLFSGLNSGENNPLSVDASLKQPSLFNSYNYTSNSTNEVDLDNKENLGMNLNTQKNLFLQRKIALNEEELFGNKKYEFDSESFDKKGLGLVKEGKPLKEIKFNERKNQLKNFEEDSNCSILEMAIKEKNALDKEEKEKKKYMKIQMIKQHQRCKYIQEKYGVGNINGNYFGF